MTDKNRDEGELPLITNANDLEHPDVNDGDKAEAPEPDEDDDE